MMYSSRWSHPESLESPDRNTYQQTLPEPLPIALLASGRGSNVMAVLKAITEDRLPARVCLVLSDEPDAPVLDKARQAGIPTDCIQRRDYPTRDAFETALAERLAREAPQLIVLAGFMRVLGPRFIDRFRDRLINLHPSLLPKFPGLDTYQRALDAGELWHGASVHQVTEVLDGGPVIARRAVCIEADDTAESLRLRVQKAEHQLLPETVAELAERWRAGDWPLCA